MRLTWVFTVASETTSRSAISASNGLGSPSSSTTSRVPPGRRARRRIESATKSRRAASKVVEATDTKAWAPWLALALERRHAAGAHAGGFAHGAELRAVRVAGWRAALVGARGARAFGEAFWSLWPPKLFTECSSPSPLPQCAV